MGTLTVTIPDEMEDDVEAYLDRNPQYLDAGELVREALRHELSSTASRPHGEILDDDSQISDDDPLFTFPAVEVSDPVDEANVDDVVYRPPDE